MYSFPNMDSKTENRVFHAAVYSTASLLVRLCLSYEYMSRRLVITGIKKGCLLKYTSFAQDKKHRCIIHLTSKNGIMMTAFERCFDNKLLMILTPLLPFCLSLAEM